ncbi:DUF1194 domain-containing protein [Luteolibacter sp. AS25]|uniref:DUF1194 domain-containing protein n=1 Tax=Luteolibacter sp. AS25 TaxID=3135776 RepID=UPI00398B9F27
MSLICSIFLAQDLLAAPVQVDSELLFLVDVSSSIDDSNFSTMMTGYGNAMKSGEILAAIESGNLGKIAVSVLFFSSKTKQSIGVEWMEISDFTSAQAFSNLITSVVRPFTGRTGIGSAIEFATPLFGTETGGAENGFESVVQIIDVAGDGIDNHSASRSLNYSDNVAAARDAALASGVEMVNGLALNDPSGELAEYYSSYVIGGSAAGTQSFVESAAGFEDFEAALLRKLLKEIKAGQDASVIAAIPEPSMGLLALLTTVIFLKRRR